MDNVQKSTRLTLVGQDGTVLYDSVQDDTTLENHKNRKEIKGAMENGRGEAVRTSDTLGQKTDPINHLDLEHPLDNDVYEELTPLLQGIDVQNREKEKAAEMRKEFSAKVSHELKTPLTSISGYAEIMKNGLVRPEDMKGFSELIYNEASRLITLVEDIIKISKLDE